MKDLNKLSPIVNDLASQCVKCALCLPHCPTYELTQDENESPRGRIALFQALAQEKLPLTAHVKTHLDQCLGCRACERVCPAHVEYGQLLSLGRALLHDLPTKGSLPHESLRTRFLSWILIKPSLRRFLHWLLWDLEVTGLRRFANFLKIPTLLGLQPLNDLLPPVVKPRHFQPRYEAIGTKRGTVMLFTGCISSLCDQETLAASIYVLRRLGMEVLIPKQQNCCGAIALHAGELTKATQLAAENTAAFASESPVDAIITTATGCSAVLESTQFSAKVMDIISFIQTTEWPSDFLLHPLNTRVILHTPCTLRNVLKTGAFVEQLFARIPELTWKSFSSPHCCGAAGTYLLEHPTLAEPLARNLLSELDNIQGDFIATSNIGCALQLYQYLKKQSSAIRIGHPVLLLAKALGF